MLLAFAWTASVAAAQRGADTSGRAASSASVSGHVEAPGAERQLPIPGVFVTLHRVGADSSGPVDSVRTDASGRYVIQYRRQPGDEAVYFAAAVYRGIAYFSAPIRSAHASGEEGAITVFDTTSRPLELHVRGHHFVVSAPRPDGSRDIVEVWELSNDTTVTVIGKDTLSPIWSAVLPAGATSFRSGQGDVSADALIARGDRVLMTAPFGPGVKQISYSYSVPARRFPLTIPLEKPNVVLEVLLEEPLAQVSGALLRGTDAATTQGRTFKRFLAQDVPAGESLRIAVPTTSASTRARMLVVLAGLIALAMVGALAYALRRSGGRIAMHAVIAPQDTEALVAAIAALDARHEQGDSALDAPSYVADRAALKTKLAAALAERDRGA